jgi:hypothetical protein
MAAQEVLHAGIEEEAQEDVARITQHHDEGHQGTLCTACKMANVSFVRRLAAPTYAFELHAACAARLKAERSNQREDSTSDVQSENSSLGTLSSVRIYLCQRRPSCRPRGIFFSFRFTQRRRRSPITYCGRL